MINRRKLIIAGCGALVTSVLPRVASSAQRPNLQQSIDSSDLIYLTPIRNNGKESSCQAEVWFVPDGTDLYIVTAAEAWRAQAVKQGLTQARIWIGDLGQWRGTKGKYKTLPKMEATATLITSAAEHKNILDGFGKKYPMSWLVYESRFRDGLADGSRVMLRYQPIVE